MMRAPLNRITLWIPVLVLTLLIFGLPISWGQHEVAIPAKTRLFPLLGLGHEGPSLRPTKERVDGGAASKKEPPGPPQLE